MDIFYKRWTVLLMSYVARYSSRTLGVVEVESLRFKVQRSNADRGSASQRYINEYERLFQITACYIEHETKSFVCKATTGNVNVLGGEGIATSSHSVHRFCAPHENAGKAYRSYVESHDPTALLLGVSAIAIIL